MKFSLFTQNKRKSEIRIWEQFHYEQGAKVVEQRWIGTWTPGFRNIAFANGSYQVALEPSYPTEGAATEALAQLELGSKS